MISKVPFVKDRSLQDACEALYAPVRPPDVLFVVDDPLQPLGGAPDLLQSTLLTPCG